MTVIIRNSRELGEAIRAERLKRKLRQTDLASMASVRQALIAGGYLSGAGRVADAQISG